VYTCAVKQYEAGEPHLQSVISISCTISDLDLETWDRTSFRSDRKRPQLFNWPKRLLTTGWAQFSGLLHVNADIAWRNSGFTLDRRCTHRAWLAEKSSSPTIPVGSPPIRKLPRKWSSVRIGDHPPGTHKTVRNRSWKRASGCSRQPKIMTRRSVNTGQLSGTYLSVGGSRSGAANTPPIVITDRS